MPHNAAVERPRDDVSSAPRVHNEMTHMRRARDAVRSNCLLADKLVVVRMAANPEPLNAIVDFVAKRSIVATNPNGPQRPDTFEMQRRVPRV